MHRIVCLCQYSLKMGFKLYFLVKGAGQISAYRAHAADVIRLHDLRLSTTLDDKIMQIGHAEYMYIVNFFSHPQSTETDIISAISCLAYDRTNQ